MSISEEEIVIDDPRMVAVAEQLPAELGCTPEEAVHDALLELKARKSHSRPSSSV